MPFEYYTKMDDRADHGLPIFGFLRFLFVLQSCYYMTILFNTQKMLKHHIILLVIILYHVIIFIHQSKLGIKW